MTTWYKPADRNNKPNDGVSVEEQQAKAGSLLEYYRALVALRNVNAALRTGAMEKIEVSGNANVYAYLRRDATAAFVVVINLESKPISVALDLGATTLRDGRYTATDALASSSKPIDMDGLTLNLNLDAASGYVMRMTTR